jgi:PAS domain-containing protein
MNNNYKIYCDLDGVLVDFDKGYYDLTGIDTEKRINLTKEKFWEPIVEAGSKWWEELEWTKDGKELWNYIKKHSPIILSAPSREKSSKIGKRKWIKKYLPNIPLILKPAYEKCLFSSPTSILIDDNKDNIEQWINKGGIGILHITTKITIKELKRYDI